MFYMVQPSYATNFANIVSQFLFYGIAEGPPSIENGNWATAHSDRGRIELERALDLGCQPGELCPGKSKPLLEFQCVFAGRHNGRNQFRS